MPTTKPAPEDRKPAKSAGFAFTDNDGKWHVIPYATTLLDRIEFGEVLDLIGADMATANNTMAARLRDLLDPSDDGVIAMRSLPMTQGLKLFQRWFAAPDDKGVSVGELLAS